MVSHSHLLEGTANPLRGISSSSCGRCFCLPFVLKTSLLCRLQAQTLSDATPLLGKIPPFTKIAVTF